MLRYIKRKLGTGTRRHGASIPIPDSNLDSTSESNSDANGASFPNSSPTRLSSGSGTRTPNPKSNPNPALAPTTNFKPTSGDPVRHSARAPDIFHPRSLLQGQDKEKGQQTETDKEKGKETEEEKGGKLSLKAKLKIGNPVLSDASGAKVAEKVAEKFASLNGVVADWRGVDADTPRMTMTGSSLHLTPMMPPTPTMPSSLALPGLMTMDADAATNTNATTRSDATQGTPSPTRDDRDAIFTTIPLESIIESPPSSPRPTPETAINDATSYRHSWSSGILLKGQRQNQAVGFRHCMSDARCHDNRGAIIGMQLAEGRSSTSGFDFKLHARERDETKPSTTPNSDNGRTSRLAFNDEHDRGDGMDADTELDDINDDAGLSDLGELRGLDLRQHDNNVALDNDTIPPHTYAPSPQGVQDAGLDPWTGSRREHGEETNLDARFMLRPGLNMSETAGAAHLETEGAPLTSTVIDQQDQGQAPRRHVRRRPVPSYSIDDFTTNATPQASTSTRQAQTVSSVSEAVPQQHEHPPAGPIVSKHRKRIVQYIDPGTPYPADGWAVPDTWKTMLDMKVTKPISAEMFVTILRECSQLTSIFVTLTWRDITGPNNKNLNMIVAHAANLQTMCITTSVELGPVLSALKLPKLKFLLLEWDSRLGQTIPSPPKWRIGFAGLARRSNCPLTSLRLKGIFPSEAELLDCLLNRASSLEELLVLPPSTQGHGNDSSNFLGGAFVSKRRRVTDDTLTALADVDLFPRMRRLGLSCVTARDGALTIMAKARTVGTLKLHLELVFSSADWERHRYDVVALDALSKRNKNFEGVVNFPAKEETAAGLSRIHPLYNNEYVSSC
ncbi:hypothetical protein DXG03_004120 [Asterophora parasitica]|uniref:Uncharacterized protein n=1 Tax=Asterophora parasitica TaxID=117018 RepID=A0A9P7G4C3_9AGAR|nr:hypothetical protein DXG03_004120 [Asterophora parasitica]